MAKEKRPNRPTAAEWVRVTSHSQSGQTRPTANVRDQNTNKKRVGEAGNDSRPTETGLVSRTSTARDIVIIAGVIALVTIAVYALVQLGTEQKQHPTVLPAPQVTVPTNTPIKVASTPTAAPTGTPHPTWTPRPKPPTSTPLPVTTKAEPTPTVDMTTHYVNLFASCDGQYTGETEEKRRKAAQHTLKVGYRTLQELVEIVEEKCE